MLQLQMSITSGAPIGNRNHTETTNINLLSSRFPSTVFWICLVQTLDDSRLALTRHFFISNENNFTVVIAAILHCLEY